jgi:hypothetical protein
MTNQQHPITPPLEMVEQWADMLSSRSDHAVFSLASQWGSDQELEACCMWTHDWYGNGSGEVVGNLRAARRPKPPSLKEQALEQLGCIQTDLNKFGMGISTDTIRRALEQLND